ncbi:Similar to Uncharacterized protein C26F1.08c; acc. no. Q10495 [Pyronema omphalodes CBS 100304]|uniref:Similar to Uncharacterized protein C26F1.08c acc. no. Q10495 n=1 Tax=Pyronema omphalodes (strain CBS 100304) TaxID=1076935 RepID=U4LE48_PYROM|nr:Similar to Uncharacterized protein C26F1.08c; acc. no. Q10495 [Pyronema omphalodes CBS 100304]
MVIKSSLAYFIGSLATYVTPVSDLLGRYDGKHMVATFCTYFHPARSAGSMHQATLYALAAFFYSTFISIGSMALSIFFNKMHMIQLGHALVLIIFCAGGLGFIGYIKQTKAHPTVSVACSLASISIITILTKEGSVQRAQFNMGKIWQVSLILLMSIAISNVLAFLLWPSSAIDDLRQLMVTCFDDFSEKLGGITHSFLQGSFDDVNTKYASIENSHRAVFGLLQKHLQEAKYEHYLRGTEKQFHQMKLLVESMQRLAQNIGGLGSAAHTQFMLLKEIRERESGAIPMNFASRLEDPSDAGRLFTPPSRTSDYLLFDDDTISVAESHVTGSESDTGLDNTTTPLTVLNIFMYHLGPPMKSLAYTLREIMDDLPFESQPPYRINVNPMYDDSLDSAVRLFEDKQREALNNLYKSDLITKRRSVEEAADVEETAASCGYFSDNLTFLAEEMKAFLELLEELQYLQETRVRSWEWLKFWKRGKKGSKSPEEEELLRHTTTVEPSVAPPKKAKTIPNVSPDDKVTFTYKVWKGLSALRNDNVKFSVKVGLGAGLYALPAFIPYTRPMFSQWRGEWGLVSYMIIMSMTLGQTNNSGEARVVGTMIGAILAWFAWVVFPENPYALSLFGFVVSLPCFYIILNWKQATFGRFILLTYNLSALYAYSMSLKNNDHKDDDEGGVNPIITNIVLHRFVAVTVGVVWGLFVNRMIWPISARSQLRKGLSVLWLRMALIWSHDPLNGLIDGSREKYRSITEDYSLQKTLIHLNGLAAAAPHEFRLKGPFPVKEYGNIHKANQSILDAFHGMSVMISKDPKANRREMEILNFTKKARDRLLAKLFEYRANIRGTDGEADEDFATVYAYALVTARISEGLDELIRNVELLYGVLEDEMLEI